MAAEPTENTPQWTKEAMDTIQTNREVAGRAWKQAEAMADNTPGYKTIISRRYERE